MVLAHVSADCVHDVIVGLAPGHEAALAVDQLGQLMLLWSKSMMLYAATVEQMLKLRWAPSWSGGEGGGFACSPPG